MKNYWRDVYWQYDWTGKYAWRKSASMDKIINEIAIDDTVLDLGCGKAELYRIIQHTNEYTGIDFSSYVIKLNKEIYGLHFIEMDLNDLYKVETKYDVVVIRDTLEAVKDWQEVLKQALRLAKKKLIVVLRRTLSDAPTKLVESNPEQGIYVWDINEKELLDVMGGSHSIVDGDSVIIKNI